MIVQKITAHHHEDKMQEAIALLKAERDRVQFSNTARFYKPLSGEAGVVIGEYEFADPNSMEKFWADWESQSEAQAFLQKYEPLLKAETISEILELL